jgi:hypothetical protein
MSSSWGIDAASMATAVAYLLIMTAAAGLAHMNGKQSFRRGMIGHFKRYPFFPLSFEFVIAAALALYFAKNAVQLPRSGPPPGFDLRLIFFYCLSIFAGLEGALLLVTLGIDFFEGEKTPVHLQYPAALFLMAIAIAGTTAAVFS